MTMSVSDLDQALAAWDRDLLAAQTNMLDLEKLFAYQALLSSSAWVKLEGVSKTRAGQILTDFQDVWKHLRLLQETIDRARKLRGQISTGMFSSRSNEDLLQQAEKLLTTPSIKLAVHEIPLAQRGLLQGAGTTDETVKPRALLDAMVDAFAKCNAIVHEIDAAWTRLTDELAKPKDDVQRLVQLAQELGITAHQLLQSAQKKLADIEKQVQTDPLGALVDFDADFSPLLAQIRAEFEEAKKSKESLNADMATAQTRLEEIEFLHGQVKTAYNDSQLKVLNPVGLVPADDETAVADFRERLDNIRQFQAEGQWRVASKAVNAWLKQTVQYEAALKVRLDANQAPLLLRDDLRSQLAAWQSKANARALIEHPSLQPIARAAKDILFSRPSDLTQAAALVTQYETVLNQLIASSPSAGA